jgi:PKD repeat protein
MRHKNKSTYVALSVLIALLTPAAWAQMTADPVARWDIQEVALKGPQAGNPFVDVQLSAEFKLEDRLVKAPGFYDGQGTYRIRFMPDAEGQWTYITRSSVPELDGKRGTFTCTVAGPGNHGPVQVFQTFYLRYADGTPYHQFGTTCYAWVHQTRELQAQTLQTLAASPFNKIRFCVFPKSYAYNQNEPEFFAFKKGANGKFDFSQPDPAFWRHFEQRIVDLQRLGIEADLILWHPYDRWGFADMSDEQDDRYLRYCIARLSAYRNVWWSLANEYDFMTNRPQGHRGNKHWEDWDRFFSILQKEDPHQRLRGIHNGSKWYDHTKEWVTHASLQTSDMDGGVRFRTQYRKPVIYDECKYEGDIPQGWGNLTARDMAQRFWLGTLSGCYVGHGETYKHPQDILWWAKGGVLHGQSPQRIQWLKDLMAQAPAFHELQPLGDGKGTFVLAKEGEYCLVYCLDQRSQRVRLAGSRPYKVDLIDPWEMTVSPVGTASPGEYTFSAPKADQVYRFTPYQPGEALRPEARIIASATEGLPPLKVQFASAAEGRVRWDFGDGATSQDSKPTHVFEKPGLYSVRLTVTDAQGSSAEAFQSIAVDRDVTEPILRVGMPQGKETPGVTLHGTARRTDNGSFHLPDGAPWGWVQVGKGNIEGLRGLRSFTIMGWLKPESLQAGSGGNRILFCLKQSRSGIDLVCQSDGRLRLAVNEWPDSVRNDSSPGKLQPGKWTYFAVSYDATASGDNVSWYFSAPSDTPGQPVVALDRKTAYHAGPVDNDIGPLAIGNFNETMHGYGLDRQFRGGIGAVQVFGSRVSGRGALKVDEINSWFRSLESSANAIRANTGAFRPRVIVSTDFPPTNVVIRDAPADQCSDPDDMQSMVRFLLHTNEFDVEGLIASSGTFANIARKQNMLDVIALYDQVDENLRKHDPRYPTADYLRSVTFQGLTGTWGKSVSNNMGSGKDSEASNAIIRIVDKPDPRPVWCCVWGDCSNIAQAIWKVQNTRSAAELQTFLSKIRIHQIAHQDDTIDWLLENFPDLFIIYSKTTYQGMFGGSDPMSDLAWVNTNIRQNHGPLGAVYPPAGMGCSGVCEGDSPSFLHLVSAVRGLNNPKDPTQESWGGQFKRVGTTHHYVDGPGRSSISKWRPQYQAEFALRADWMTDR